MSTGARADWFDKSIMLEADQNKMSLVPTAVRDVGGNNVSVDDTLFVDELDSFDHLGHDLVVERRNVDVAVCQSISQPLSAENLRHTDDTAGEQGLVQFPAECVVIPIGVNFQHGYTCVPYCGTSGNDMWLVRSAPHQSNG